MCLPLVARTSAGMVAECLSPLLLTGHVRSDQSSPQAEHRNHHQRLSHLDQQPQQASEPTAAASSSSEGVYHDNNSNTANDTTGDTLVFSSECSTLDMDSSLLLVGEEMDCSLEMFSSEDERHFEKILLRCSSWGGRSGQ
jgi:hypothetical protein